MNCPECKQPNGPERNFCGGCGGPLAQFCRSCGFRNHAADRFCGGCGASLSTAAKNLPVAPHADSLAAVSPAEGPGDMLSELLEAAREDHGREPEEPVGHASQEDIDGLFEE